MERFLAGKEVDSIMGCSSSLRYERIADGTFVHPVTFTSKLTRFPENDVKALHELYRRGADESEIRALVKSLEALRPHSIVSIPPVRRKRAAAQRTPVEQSAAE